MNKIAPSLSPGNRRNKTQGGTVTERGQYCLVALYPSSPPSWEHLWNAVWKSGSMAGRHGYGGQKRFTFSSPTENIHPQHHCPVTTHFHEDNKRQRSLHQLFYCLWKWYFLCFVKCVFYCLFLNPLSRLTSCCARYEKKDCWIMFWTFQKMQCCNYWQVVYEELQTDVTMFNSSMDFFFWSWQAFCNFPKGIASERFQADISDKSSSRLSYLEQSHIKLMQLITALIAFIYSYYRDFIYELVWIFICVWITNNIEMFVPSQACTWRRKLQIQVKEELSEATVKEAIACDWADTEIPAMPLNVPTFRMCQQQNFREFIWIAGYKWQTFNYLLRFLCSSST